MTSEISERTESGAGFDGRHLRDVFGAVPSGVAVICGTTNADLSAMVVCTLTPVSLEPPLVSICVQSKSRTWSRLRTSELLGVSILGEHQHGIAAAVAAQGAGSLLDIQRMTMPGGAVVVRGGVALLETILESEVSAGDHIIVVLRIAATWVTADSAPLVFHGSRYRQLQSQSFDLASAGQA